jgi:hypothetical protein
MLPIDVTWRDAMNSIKPLLVMHVYIESIKMTYQLVLRMVVLFAFAMVNVACDSHSTPQSPPIRLKFDLGNPNEKLEVVFKVLEFRNYSVGFEILFDKANDADKEKIRESIAKTANSQNSAPIQIDVEIISLESGVQVKEKTYSELKLLAWGRSGFNVEMDQIQLRPGKYRLSLRNQHPVGLFHSVETNFMLSSYPKSKPIAEKRIK